MHNKEPTTKLAKLQDSITSPWILYLKIHIYTHTYAKTIDISSRGRKTGVKWARNLCKFSCNFYNHMLMS